MPNIRVPNHLVDFPSSLIEQLVQTTKPDPLSGIIQIMAWIPPYKIKPISTHTLNSTRHFLLPICGHFNTGLVQYPVHKFVIKWYIFQIMFWKANKTLHCSDYGLKNWASENQTILSTVQVEQLKSELLLACFSDPRYNGTGHLIADQYSNGNLGWNSPTLKLYYLSFWLALFPWKIMLVEKSVIVELGESRPWILVR